MADKQVLLALFFAVTAAIAVDAQLTLEERAWQDALRKAKSDVTDLNKLAAVVRASRDVPGDKAEAISAAIYAAGCATAGRMDPARKALDALGEMGKAETYTKRLTSDALLKPCNACGGDSKILRQCSRCGGNGLCKACVGAGRRTVPSFSGTRNVLCTACRQTGKCPTCKGHKTTAATCRRCEGKGKVLSEARVRGLCMKLLEEALGSCSDKRFTRDKSHVPPTKPITPATPRVVASTATGNGLPPHARQESENLRPVNSEQQTLQPGPHAASGDGTRTERGRREWMIRVLAEDPDSGPAEIYGRPFGFMPAGQGLPTGFRKSRWRWPKNKVAAVVGPGAQHTKRSGSDMISVYHDRVRESYCISDEAGLYAVVVNYPTSEGKSLMAALVAKYGKVPASNIRSYVEPGAAGRGLTSVLETHWLNATTHVKLVSKSSTHSTGVTYLRVTFEDRRELNARWNKALIRFLQSTIPDFGRKPLYSALTWGISLKQAKSIKHDGKLIFAGWQQNRPKNDVTSLYLLDPWRDNRALYFQKDKGLLACTSEMSAQHLAGGLRTLFILQTLCCSSSCSSLLFRSVVRLIRHPACSQKVGFPWRPSPNTST